MTRQLPAACLALATLCCCANGLPAVGRSEVDAPTAEIVDAATATDAYSDALQAAFDGFETLDKNGRRVGWAKLCVGVDPLLGDLLFAGVRSPDPIPLETANDKCNFAAHQQAILAASTFSIHYKYSNPAQAIIQVRGVDGALTAQRKIALCEGSYSKDCCDFDMAAQKADADPAVDILGWLVQQRFSGKDLFQIADLPSNGIVVRTVDRITLLANDLAQTVQFAASGVMAVTPGGQILTLGQNPNKQLILTRHEAGLGALTGSATFPESLLFQTTSINDVSSLNGRVGTEAAALDEGILAVVIMAGKPNRPAKVVTVDILAGQVHELWPPSPGNVGAWPEQTAGAENSGVIRAIARGADGELWIELDDWALAIDRFDGHALQHVNLQPLMNSNVAGGWTSSELALGRLGSSPTAWADGVAVTQLFAGPNMGLDHMPRLGIWCGSVPMN